MSPVNHFGNILPQKKKQKTLYFVYEFRKSKHFLDFYRGIQRRWFGFKQEALFPYCSYTMKASVKHIRISPKKANLVAGLVRGKMAEDALSFLKFANKKGADILYKLLASAVANAENNDAKTRSGLIIDTIVVTKGRTLRRGIPASRGRVAPIKKRSSHIFLELRDSLKAS